MYPRRLLAEMLGTALLLLGIVGSGIQAERLTDVVALQLLVNAIATAGVLTALILALGPISGAHFNPVVTLADRWWGGLDNREAVGYIGAQVAGAVLGVMLANTMFGLDAIDFSTNARSGGDLLLAEVIATFGLLLVIFGVVRSGRTNVVAFAVGAYIAAAMFFTSSTAFANPAVTAARTITATFTGIEPADAVAFVLAQLVGLAVAVVVLQALYPHIDEFAGDIVMPHDADTN